MADTNQMNLREPEQINWDNYATGSKYVAPPQAKDANGKYIVYTGQLPTTVGLDVTQEGFRSFVLDPIKLAKNGNGVDGYEIRFTRASVKKFNDRNGNPIDASMAGNVLRAAGVVAKPQSNKEYEAAFKLAAGRVVPFTIDWVARNKETGEEIVGYDNFPLDPDRPGQRKSILRAGDTLPNGQTVKSEVLFANARVKFFQDPNRK
jgi:hypothetical protein